MIVNNSENQIFGPFNSAASSGNASGIPLGTADIALVANNAYGTVAIQILRGVNVTSSTSVSFPPMTSADKVGSASASVTGAPAHTTANFYAIYRTSGGLSIPLSGPFNSSGPQSLYPTIPSSQAQSGDSYQLYGFADPVTAPFQGLNALISSQTAGALSAVLPTRSNSLNAPIAAAFPAFNANADGFSVAGTVVDASQIQFQTTPGSSIIDIDTYVTQTWLGPNTSFATPNLSGLNGFPPAPVSGVTEHWQLSSIAGTPLQFLPLSSSIVPAYPSPASVQYLDTFGAFTVP